MGDADAEADEAPEAESVAAREADSMELTPVEEADPSMLPHVHVPHHASDSWKGFLLNVVTIVMGLVIAVGLEQSVEYIHHREQRGQLDDEMHEVFQDNQRLIAGDLAQLSAFRTYLLDQQKALDAVMTGKVPQGAPSATDPRITGFLAIPGIGPYEAAKANGSVAPLSIDRIRIYNRIELQYGLLRHDVDGYFEVLAQLRSVRKRFDADGQFDKGIALSSAGQSGMTSTEMQEYRALLGSALDSTDRVMVRLRRFDAQSLAVLNGADTEGAVIEAGAHVQKDAP